MIHQLSSLNWTGVAAAFFAYFMLGAVWFTLLFKNQYAISLGKLGNMAEKPSPLFIIGPAVCSLVITIASAVLMHAFGVNSYPEAIELAVVIGIGFLVANTFNIAINPNMPYPLHYGLISSAYHLVGIILVCVILFALK